MNRDTCLNIINEMLKIISDYKSCNDPEQEEKLRCSYNRIRLSVERIIDKIGNRLYFNVSFPIVDGGHPKKNLNAFDYVFEDLYGVRATNSVVDMLNQAKGAIEIDEKFSLDMTPKKISDNKNIFIVHGHDEAMKNDVARTVEKLKLQPIILNEKPNSGMTIIEKIEKYSDVGFAIILLSPCDKGCEVGQENNLKPRARQNVIAELGYFIGKLGRQRTFILKKSDVEEPSDFSGVVYEAYDSNGGWKMKLVQELSTAGYKINLNDLLK